MNKRQYKKRNKKVVEKLLNGDGGLYEWYDAVKTVHFSKKSVEAIDALYTLEVLKRKHPKIFNDFSFKGRLMQQVLIDFENSYKRISGGIVTLLIKGVEDNEYRIK